MFCETAGTSQVQRKGPDVSGTGNIYDSFGLFTQTFATVFQTKTAFLGIGCASNFSLLWSTTITDTTTDTNLDTVYIFGRK